MHNFPTLTGLSKTPVFHIDQKINLARYTKTNTGKFQVHIFYDFKYFDTQEETEEYLIESSLHINTCFFYINQAYAEIIKFAQSNYFSLSAKELREFKLMQAAVDFKIKHMTISKGGYNDYHLKSMVFITERLCKIINVFSEITEEIQTLKNVLQSFLAWDSDLKGETYKQIEQAKTNVDMPVINARKRNIRYRPAKRTGQAEIVKEKKQRRKKEDRKDPIVEDFITYLLIEKRGSKHTAISYRHSILKFVDFLREAGKDPLDVTRKEIVTFLRNLAGENLNPRTLNNYRYAISSFYKFLGRKGLIKINPTKQIQKSKEGKKQVNFLLPVNVNYVLDNMPVNSKYDLRDKLVLELLYGTGLRVDELVNLEIDNISLTQSTIKVLGKGNKERVIPVPRVSMELIKELLSTWNHKTGFFIETDSNEKSYPVLIERIVKFYLNVNPHAIRHTYATSLLNNGANLMDIKFLLGHGSLGATQIYTHVQTDKMKRDFDQSHPRA